MIKLNSKKIQGFSTVELIIYASTMSIVFIFTGIIFISAYSFYYDVSNVSNVDLISYTAINRISRSVRNTHNVIEAESIFNSGDGQIVYEVLNSDGDIESHKIFLEDNEIIHEIDGVPTTLISPSNMTINKLTFNKISGDRSDSLKIDLEIETESRKGHTNVRSFSSFLILKNN